MLPCGSVPLAGGDAQPFLAARVGCDVGLQGRNSPAELGALGEEGAQPGRAQSWHWQCDPDLLLLIKRVSPGWGDHHRGSLLVLSCAGQQCGGADWAAF